MSVQVKLCGLTDEAAIQAVIAARADYAGFVFFPASPRHLTSAKAATLRKMLPDFIKAVSVLVDPDDALIADIVATVKPDALQLHGKETPARLREIKTAYPSLPLIKAISVRTGDDIAAAMHYVDADMLLFDAKPPNLPGVLPGGNGLSFDWALLAGHDFGKKWFLSGGLNADNVREAIEGSGARMVDVSSSIESAPGVKDPVLIHAFTNAARNA